MKVMYFTQLKVTAWLHSKNSGCVGECNNREGHEGTPWSKYTVTYLCAKLDLFTASALVQRA